MFTLCERCEAWERLPVPQDVSVPAAGKCLRNPPYATIGQAQNLAGHPVPVVLTFKPETRANEGCHNGLPIDDSYI